MLKRLFIILMLIYVGSMITAQEARNPFDLPTTEEISLETTPTSRVRSNNPFDLQPVSVNEDLQSENAHSPHKEIIPKQSALDQGMNIGISLFLIFPLALLLTLFRGVFNDFLEAAYRDRKFNQFFRRPNSMWVAPNLLLYLFFFISISVFTHLTLTYYGYGGFGKTPQSIGFLMLSFAGFFTIKHALLFFLGDTFDVKNEAKRYSLLILTFNIIIGIFLTPFNLLLLLGPESMKGTIVILGLLLVGLVFLLFLLRSLSLSNRLLLQHSLHFFMYLCMIEIAPLFIVAKLLT